MKKLILTTVACLAVLCTGLFGFTALALSGLSGCSSDGTGARVEKARAENKESIRRMFEEAGAEYPPCRVFIRVFKLEGELEVWAQGKEGDAFRKIKTYGICSRSGELGPKRKQGDMQVPEGFYRVDRYNPCSRFHLSLGIDYPNRSDLILGDSNNPGGDIFIHGSCVTIGCVPIGDDAIEELYLVSLDSREKGGSTPEVHIFPCRMEDSRCAASLAEKGGADKDLEAFWQSLRPAYSYFEKHLRPPGIEIDEAGTYHIKPRKDIQQGVKD